MNDQVYTTSTRRWWNVLFVFTLVVTLGVTTLLVALPQVGGDAIRSSIIFIFYPVFDFLHAIHLFHLQNYGMGSVALLVTVPLGIVWVTCITSLTLFGVGKFRATNNPTYALIRKTLIIIGVLYLILSVRLLLKIILA